jgi:hypothetical protein
MGLKPLRYQYWCPFNHESERTSSPRSNLSYFLGTTLYRSRSSQNALQHKRWSKLPGLGPVSWSAMAVKSVVRAIPSSTETPERSPEIHEGLPNLAESNVPPQCHDFPSDTFPAAVGKETATRWEIATWKKHACNSDQKCEQRCVLREVLGTEMVADPPVPIYILSERVCRNERIPNVSREAGGSVSDRCTCAYRKKGSIMTCSAYSAEACPSRWRGSFSRLRARATGPVPVRSQQVDITPTLWGHVPAIGIMQPTFMVTTKIILSLSVLQTYSLAKQPIIHNHELCWFGHLELHVHV